MSTWHFALALTIGVWAYALLPAQTGFAAATFAYVLWRESRA